MTFLQRLRIIRERMATFFDRRPVLRDYLIGLAVGATIALGIGILITTGVITLPVTIGAFALYSAITFGTGLIASITGAIKRRFFDAPSNRYQMLDENDTSATPLITIKAGNETTQLATLNQAAISKSLGVDLQKQKLAEEQKAAEEAQRVADETRRTEANKRAAEEEKLAAAKAIAVEIVDKLNELAKIPGVQNHLFSHHLDANEFFTHYSASDMSPIRTFDKFKHLIPAGAYTFLEKKFGDFKGEIEAASNILSEKAIDEGKLNDEHNKLENDANDARMERARKQGVDLAALREMKGQY